MPHAELLAAILASPDDDAPRLLYADRLRQEGDPRGELIALQCKESLDAAEQARELALLDAHRDAWAQELGLGGQQVKIRRGFIEEVLVTPEQLEAMAADGRRAPLRTVRVASCRTRALGGVVEACTRLGVARILTWPHTAALESIDLTGTNVPLTDVRGLLESRPNLVLYAREAARAQLAGDLGDRVRTSEA